MSSGKKKHPKRKTYTQGEMRQIVQASRDEVVARALILAICSAREMFDMDEEMVVRYMENVQRWNRFLSDGVISIDDLFSSLKKQTGIDLKLTRW